MRKKTKTHSYNSPIRNCYFFIYIYHQSNKANNIELEISNDFLNKFKFEEISSDYDSATLNGRYDGSVIKIKILNNVGLKQSENYIYDKIFVINSMYRDIDSPYPGALSNKISCDEEFKPQKIPNTTFDYYMLYATSRFTYGACSWNLIEYRSYIYFAYCNESENLYQIELFLPIKKETTFYEESLKSIAC